MVRIASLPSSSCPVKLLELIPERREHQLTQSLFCLTRNWALGTSSSVLFSSSQTQGQLVGARESRNGRKKFRQRKVKYETRSPWDTVLPDQFQTVGVILASDWCHKTCVFLCPIREQQDQESFRVFLHGLIKEGQLLAMFVFARGEKF